MYSFPNESINSDTLKLDFDRKAAACIYQEMNITPSVAATLPMWQFINMELLPDVVYWRFGANKERFYSERRNYFGTQWWRHYLFLFLTDSKIPSPYSVYSKLSEHKISELYERSGTRGLPDHIYEIAKWFFKLKGSIILKNERATFRSVIKKYNAELGFRNYFSLDETDKYNIFKKCFNESL